MPSTLEYIRLEPTTFNSSTDLRSLSLLRNKVKVYELKNRSCLSLVVLSRNFL